MKTCAISRRHPRFTSVSRSILATGVVMCGTTLAEADVVTNAWDMPEGSTVYDFSDIEGFEETNNATNLGNHGITWTASNDGWIGDMAFGLRQNGHWDWDMEGYVGLNEADASMTFTFDAPVSAIGGFVNYAPLEGFGPIPTIEAYDAKGELLESFSMDVQTPGGVNEGQFMGFIRGANEIASLRFTARYGVLDMLTFNRMTVPAPSAIMVLIGAGLVMRRRDQG